MADLIKVRRDTEANWLAADPVLSDGEPGFIRDTYQIVMGDGSTVFSGLSRFSVVSAPEPSYANSLLLMGA